jgi:hypothetical protein
MALTLLEVGATSSQADLTGITAFHYYVHNSAEAMLTLFDNDKAAALSALNHVAVSGNMWNPTTANPLSTAIENRDAVTTLKLLDASVPRIDYSAWIKSAKTAFVSKWNKMEDPKKNLELFNKSVEQPVVLAVEKELPSIILEMLAKGADPNTVTKLGSSVLQEEYQRRYTKGETLLDVVRKKLDELRLYKSEQEPESPPEALKDDVHYLSGLEPGTYKHWIASTNLKNAKRTYDAKFTAYQRKIKDAKKPRPGLKHKENAIKECISTFEKVEQELLTKGGKTFKQLHPDIEDPDNSQTRHHYEPPKPKPFEVTFNFAVGELTEDLKELYIEL